MSAAFALHAVCALAATPAAAALIAVADLILAVAVARAVWRETSARAARRTLQRHLAELGDHEGAPHG